MTREDKVRAFEMRVSGKSYEEIAKEFGVTRQRIQQILSDPIKGRPGYGYQKCKIKPVADWIRNNHITNRMIAEKTGVSESVISKQFQKGKLSPKLLIGISEMSGIPEEKIVLSCWENEKQEYVENTSGMEQM
jgi:predicted transcriptional regulator